MLAAGLLQLLSARKYIVSYRIQTVSRFSAGGSDVSDYSLDKKTENKKAAEF